MKTLTNTIYPAFALVAFACFALSPQARATCREGCDLNRANTFFGDDPLVSNTTGVANTAIGSAALQNNTTGSFNTAVGSGALFDNQTGLSNTAIGFQTLVDNTGSNNTATGSQALWRNTTGNNNNAYGETALMSNTTGPFNNAFGNGALASNTTGDRNTAIGEGAMTTSTTGYQNTAVGVSALRNNSTGFYNVAIGQDACNLNGSGSGNTGVGWQALLSNRANNSTAVGMDALVHSTGSNNVGLGVNAGANLTAGNFNIDIGAPGVAGESRRIRIGTAGTQNATFIVGIRGATVPSGVGVIVGPNHQLGTVQSSKRFKEAIKPMEKASEAILALKPVTFRYKKELDPDKIPQFGLIAEEVEKVNPDLVARDAEGKVYTVRYDAVNAMLLNEFIKEHRENEEQEKTIAELKSGMTALAAMVDEQAALIQKVSAQLELTKPKRRVAENHQ
jgi:hypothetical protein